MAIARSPTCKRIRIAEDDRDQRGAIHVLDLDHGDVAVSVEADQRRRGD